RRPPRRAPHRSRCHLRACSTASAADSVPTMTVRRPMHRLVFLVLERVVVDELDVLEIVVLRIVLAIFLRVVIRSFVVRVRSAVARRGRPRATLAAKDFVRTLDAMTDDPAAVRTARRKGVDRTLEAIEDKGLIRQRDGEAVFIVVSAHLALHGVSPFRCNAPLRHLNGGATVMPGMWC